MTILHIVNNCSIVDIKETVCTIVHNGILSLQITFMIPDRRSIDGFDQEFQLLKPWHILAEYDPGAGFTKGLRLSLDLG